MTRLSDSPLRVDVPVLHAAPFHLRLARCWPKRTAVLLSTQAVGELRGGRHARNVCFAEASFAEACYLSTQAVGELSRGGRGARLLGRAFLCLSVCLSRSSIC